MFQSLYIIERDKDFELLIMGKEDFVQNDFLLIRKMKQGDDDALDLFVHKYYQDILNYCHYHCSDKTYAERFGTETFVHFSQNYLIIIIGKNLELLIYDSQQSV